MEYAEKIESKNRYSFNISYQGTSENAETHNRFKAFADQYDKVYIAALRVLLDSYEQHHEYDAILAEVAELTAEVASLREELAKKEEKKPQLKTFGQ
jgi:hypothetical protein